jgi:serine/threonine protein kinase
MPLGLAPGDVFAGRYEIVRRIAAGAMGEVYEVIHRTTGRRRALKIMLPHIVQSAELRERFTLEARIAAQVNSEFIVDVSDAGVDEGTEVPFLVMELLQGEELGRRLKRVGRFPPEEALRYVYETALALDKTHKASIVHRDLKPGNLFLAETSQGTHVKVLDFGVAKIVADGTTQANATAAVGTPLYMAPEQFRGGRKISSAADIYALGMIAYTFLVGEAYWWEELRRDGNVVGFALAAVHGPEEPASVRAARRGVTLPPLFDPWFAKATAADPKRRFGTAVMAAKSLAEVFSLPAPEPPISALSGAFRAVPSVPEISQDASSMSVAGSTATAGLSPRVLTGAAVALAALAIVAAVAYATHALDRSSAAAPSATAGSDAPAAVPSLATATASVVVTPAPAIAPPAAAASSAAPPRATGRPAGRPAPAGKPRAPAIYSPD